MGVPGFPGLPNGYKEDFSHIAPVVFSGIILLQLTPMGFIQPAFFLKTKVHGDVFIRGDVLKFVPLWL